MRQGGIGRGPGNAGSRRRRAWEGVRLLHRRSRRPRVLALLGITRCQLPAGKRSAASNAESGIVGALFKAAGRAFFHKNLWPASRLLRKPGAGMEHREIRRRTGLSAERYPRVWKRTLTPFCGGRLATMLGPHRRRIKRVWKKGMPHGAFAGLSLCRARQKANTADFMPRLPAQRKARLGKETGQGFAVHSKNNGNIVSAINYRKIKEDSQYIGENNDKIAENEK